MICAPSCAQLVAVPTLGPAGCGKVVPFLTRRHSQVALHRHELTAPQVFIACGDSMIGRGIVDGDTLICTSDFNIWQANNKICVVSVFGEYIAKIVILNNDGTVTLKSANSNYEDRVVEIGEVLILGIVVKIQRNVD